MIGLDQLAAFLTVETSIDFERRSQRHVLRRCIERRATALGYVSVDAYVAQIRDASDPEARWLVNALTVGHTWFYRDASQMEVIADLITRARPRPRPLNVWVAGCATGEDGYCIAMLAERVRREALVLCTDINTTFLDKARAATYEPWALRDLPADLDVFFSGKSDGRRTVVPAIRSSVRFEHHNLTKTPPDTGTGEGWDLILCRNVIIYFSVERAHATMVKLGRALSTDGRLLIGASELIHSLPDDLAMEESRGRVMLRRVVQPSAPVRIHPVPPSHDAEPSIPLLVKARIDSSWPSSERYDAARPPAPKTRTRAEVDKLAAGGSMGDLDEENLAANLLVRGDLDGAIDHYLQILEADSLSVEPRMLLGIAYHLRGDTAAAINALRAALFLDASLWPAAYYLARTYEQLGLTAEAQREYRRVLETHSRARPLKGSAAFEDLERWKRDVVELARRRIG